MVIQVKTTSRKTAATTSNPKTASKPDFFSKSDPDGSYTGVAADGGMPRQDADDL